jgi:Tfp pilus assembly protein PilE
LHIRDVKRPNKLSQSGINMVDLMMWLVIAALLLAAAIQGINYYQQAAYVYQAKSDLAGSHQWAGAFSSMNDGVPTGDSLTTALTDSDLKLSDANAAIIASSASKYCVAIKSANITDANNVFYSTSDAPNEVKRASEMPAACGTPSVPVGSGGIPVGGAGDPVLAAGTTVVGWASHDLTTLASEETAFGVSNGMLSTYSDFVASPAFPTAYANAAATRKAPLLVAWEPYNWDVASVDQAAFRPASIAAGSYDAHITSWLTTAQTFADDNTIMVRFAPEMNDAVRPWSVGVNGGNTAADYIAMWRHVYDIKQSVAPDVIMVWNPLVAGSDGAGNAVSISSVFPGSAYVDMLALDGFNWADIQNPGTCGWQSYDDIFGGPVEEIKTLANGKPWGIAEAASASKPDSYFQSGGACYTNWGSWVYAWPEDAPFYSTASDWITQAGWTKTMIQKANADGALFVNLFNVNKETDWRLNSTPEGAGVLAYLNGSGEYGYGGEYTSSYVKSSVK